MTTAQPEGASTPAATPVTASGSPPPSLSAAASGLSQTSSIRLAPGAIPSAWTKPAEAVTRSPPPRPRPMLSGAIVGVGVVACVALAFAIGPRASTTRVAPRPPVVAAPAPTPPAPFLADGAKPIGDVPAPAPPKPAVAPEDEAGDDVKPQIAEPAAPPGTALHPAPAIAKSSTSTPTSATPASTAPVTSTPAVATPSTSTPGDELPVRQKAKGLTQRAIGLLRDGNYADAEPVLVRAVLVDPSFPDGWRHLGIARAQLGDRDGARRAYKKYLALAPNAPDAADVRKILAGTK